MKTNPTVGIFILIFLMPVYTSCPTGPPTLCRLIQWCNMLPKVIGKVRSVALRVVPLWPIGARKSATSSTVVTNKQGSTWEWLETVSRSQCLVSRSSKRTHHLVENWHVRPIGQNIAHVNRPLSKWHTSQCNIILLKQSCYYLCCPLICIMFSNLST